MLNKLINSSLFYEILEILVLALGILQVGYNNANPVIVLLLCTAIYVGLYEISGHDHYIGNPFKDASN